MHETKEEEFLVNFGESRLKLMFLARDSQNNFVNK